MSELRKSICLPKKLKLLARPVCTTDGKSLVGSKTTEDHQKKDYQRIPKSGKAGFVSLSSIMGSWGERKLMKGTWWLQLHLLEKVGVGETVWTARGKNVLKARWWKSLPFGSSYFFLFFVVCSLAAHNVTMVRMKLLRE